MKKSCVNAVLGILLFSLTTMGADLEVLTLKGTRDKIPPRLIIALAQAVDLNEEQNRASLSGILRINLERNASEFIEHSEKLQEILAFIRTKIRLHLDRLMENGVSNISVDFSPNLTRTLAQLPANQVSQYLNRLQGASFFYINIDPAAVMFKNTRVTSNSTLRVFGKIINFSNLTKQQLLSIVSEMPPLVIINDKKTYLSSLGPQDILTENELKSIIHHSLAKNGASHVEMSLNKLEDLCSSLVIKLEIENKK